MKKGKCIWKNSNDFVECALCGTGRVLSPVGKVTNQDEVIVFKNSSTEMGPVSKKLYDTLTKIQMGKIEAPQGWIKVLDEVVEKVS